MKRDAVSSIIQRIYAKKYNLVPAYEMVPAPRPFMSRVQPAIQAIRRKRVWILVVAVVVVHIVLAIYYFNLLTSNEQNVQTFHSKVMVLEQRRHDLTINLSKAVNEYSRYERSVLTSVVAMRSLLSDKGVKSPEMEQFIKEHGVPEMPVPEKGAGKLSAILPASALDRLLAVAEQYPDIKLSANYQSLMAALVEVEKDLAAQRKDHNDVVNVYTTNLAKFPSKLFAQIFGFKPVPYFESTEDARHFRPIDGN